MALIIITMVLGVILPLGPIKIIWYWLIDKTYSI